MQRVILHCDMNNYYAAIECLYNPALRDKPVAVAGDPEQRHGIVLAKNYLAKAKGVKTGEPLWQARQKCKDIVFVPPRFDRYIRFSKLAQTIYYDYTDQVEPFGLDECWLDVTGSQHLFGSGESIADQIRERIKNELGITASVGVSYNKVLAKLGSDLKKPDATTVINPEDIQTKVWPLDVSELLYVGPATAQKLKRYGISTIGQLANTDQDVLKRMFGINGIMLKRFAQGIDYSEVCPCGYESAIKSVGNSTTTYRDLITEEDIKITLYLLSESVAARLRESGLVCRTVQISVRDNQLVSFERQRGLESLTCLSYEIFSAAFSLFCEHVRSPYAVRSLGVRACNLSPANHIQTKLFPDKDRDKMEALEKSVDTIRRRFGHQCINRAIMLHDRRLSGTNPMDDNKAVYVTEGWLADKSICAFSRAVGPERGQNRQS